MRNKGFTIVELLIVIVVIAILAAISVVAYNGVQQRAAVSKRESDLASLYKAIILARESTGKTLLQITGSGYSAGHCTSYLNTSNTEPSKLPKDGDCWRVNRNVLDAISNASGVNLESLKSGDARGNPYVFDENEGEGGNCARTDAIFYFTGTNANTSVWKNVPLSGFCN